jgi:hypothetical protein
MAQEVTRSGPVIGVITNPHSRKNRGQAARAAMLQGILGGRGLVRETRSTEEIGPILDEFRARGVSYWVTDGGDGSLHWMVNSAVTRFGLTDVPAALPWTIPANGGTIDFVARHAGVRGRAESILRKLLSEHDAGRPLAVTEVPTVLVRGVQVDEAGGAERPFERIGFAAAVAGVGSGFFDQYYATSRQGAPAIVEVITRTAGAVVLDAGPWRRLFPASWLRYGRVALARVKARVSVDGRELPFEELTVFNVGAFPINLGGVIRYFQEAGQGRLHVTAGDISAFGIMANLPRMVAGRPPRSRRLFDGPVTTVHAVATGDTLLRPVLDGELIPRVRSLTISAGPSFRVPRIDGRRA